MWSVWVRICVNPAWRRTRFTQFLTRKYTKQSTVPSFLRTAVCIHLPLLQVVQEYERAVIFRLGRLLADGSRGPGNVFHLLVIAAAVTAAECQSVCLVILSPFAKCITKTPAAPVIISFLVLLGPPDCPPALPCSISVKISGENYSPTLSSFHSTLSLHFSPIQSKSTCRHFLRPPLH